MSHRTLLLFAHLGVELAIIGRALRDAGYLVFPARYHEEGIDALTRVRPDVVLVDVLHQHAVASPSFQELARELGAVVIFFTRAAGFDDAAALQVVDELPYPVVEFTGDARALAALVDEVKSGRAA